MCPTKSFVLTYSVMIAAEEGGFGKVTLLDKGAYKQMDVCLMCVTFETRQTHELMSAIC